MGLDKGPARSPPDPASRLLPAEAGWIVQRPAPEEIRHVVRNVADSPFHEPGAFSTSASGPPLRVGLRRTSVAKLSSASPSSPLAATPRSPKPPVGSATKELNIDIGMGRATTPADTLSDVGGRISTDVERHRR
jgi:hypothetical protein